MKSYDDVESIVVMGFGRHKVPGKERQVSTLLQLRNVSIDESDLPYRLRTEV